MSLTPAIPRLLWRPRRGTPHLIEALDGAAPLREQRRYPLGGADEAVLGRGEVLERRGRSLRIGLPDGFMSTAHARVRREGEGWLAEDLGSTNGTYVNGQPMRERALEDGDVLEAGRTHLIFRTAAPEELASVVPALPTLSADLADALAAAPVIARSMLPAILAGETGTGRNCWRAPCTSCRAAEGRSWPSTAPPSRRRSSSPSCSGTARARLPAPWRAGPG
jgi:hypothetical protein